MWEASHAARLGPAASLVGTLQPFQGLRFEHFSGQLPAPFAKLLLSVAKLVHFGDVATSSPLVTVARVMGAPEEKEEREVLSSRKLSLPPPFSVNLHAPSTLLTIFAAKSSLRSMTR